MKVFEFKDFNWEEYNDLIDSSISKKCFVSYFTDEYGVVSEKLEENLTTNFNEQLISNPYEMVYKSEEYKIIYIPIFKNASTSLIKSLNLKPTNLLDDNQKINQYYLKNYKFFTVIRDPKSRWISAMLEYIVAAKKLNIHTKLNIELLNSKFIFDGHFFPQFSYLYVILQSKINIDIDLIKLDSNLTDKISKFVGKKINLSHLNKTEESQFKLIFKKSFSKVLNDYCMKNKKFLELYEKDFYLYNISI